MKYLKLYISIVLSLYYGGVYAESYEKIVLKNGSEFEGYIAVQHPGKDVVFIAEKALVYIPSEFVRSIVNYDLELNSLSTEWQEWAKANQSLLKTVNKKDYLVLSDLMLQDKKEMESDTIVTQKDSVEVIPKISVQKSFSRDIVPHKVRILEKGAVVKYLDFNSNSYNIDWNEIQTIKRNKRPQTDLTGLVDVIELRSGEKFQGQILEQIPGKQIRLQREDGIVEVIDFKQISLQKKVKLNPGQSLFEQSSLMDIILLENGQCIKGIVIEQDYGTDKEPSYSLVQTFSKDIRKVEHKDIAEIRREKNPDYKEKTDVILDEGDLLINRNSTKNAIVEECEDLVTILPESEPVIFLLDSLQQQLIVETHFENGNMAEEVILLHVTPKPINKKESRLGFTYKEMVTNGVHYINKETSVNGTTRLVYPLTVAGEYVIYANKGRSIILCRIK